MRSSSKYFALCWIVEVRHGDRGGWEVMAGFNVDSVALRYAEGCRKANPRNTYRVLERVSSVSTRWKEIG